jgi:hypothetical protein
MDETMSNYVGAIKIYVGDRITKGTQSQREALGLYTPAGSGNSVFRWSEAAIAGTTDAYLPGVISDISSIRASADFRRGGAVAVAEGLTVDIVDTNQFLLRVQEMIAPKSFDGLLLEYIEFVGTDADADSVSQTIRLTGICGEPVWTETNLSIPVLNARLKRKAPVGVVLSNSSELVPVTIGKFLPSADTGVGNLVEPKVTEEIDEEFDAYDYYVNGGTVDDKKTCFPIIAYSDYIRINAAVSIGATVISVESAALFDISTPIIMYDDVGYEELSVKTYNVVGKTITLANATTKSFKTFAQGAGSVAVTPGLKFTVQISPVMSSMKTPALPDNLFMTIIDGDGNSETRKVSTVTTPVSGGVIYVTVDKAFGAIIKPTGDKQAWVKFYIKKRTFGVDSWPCGGFLNSAGTLITKATELYAFDKSYLKIPQNAIDATDEKNLEVKPFLFLDNLKNIYSFTILPFKNIKPFNGNTLYGLIDITDDGAVDGADLQEIANNNAGFYGRRTYTIGTPSIVNTADKAGDKLDTTFYGLKYSAAAHGSSSTGFWQVMEFTPPVIPADLQFDDVFLGLNMSCKSTFASAASYPGAPSDPPPGPPIDQDRLRIKWKRWRGPSVKIDGGCFNKFAIRVTDLTPSYTLAWVSTLPGFYFTNPIINNDSGFFHKKTNGPLLDFVQHVSGYESLEFSGVTDKNKYDAINGVYVCLRSNTYNVTGVQDMNVYEAAMIFRKRMSVDKIYTPFSGRVFHDTWGSRKTSTDLIENPIDVLEHFCRLQNGSEFGDTNAIGTAYSASMKIKTSGDGSFDDATLATVKNLKCSRQIVDDSAAWTDQIKSSLCKQFFLSSYIDDNGYECVKYLLAKETSPDEVTFADIIGDVGEMIEPSAADVFCQPVVKYCYSPGADSFERNLSISNINAGAYSADYAIGFSDSHVLGEVASDGEVIWEKCSALWKRFQSIEPMPSDMSELIWVADYSTAVWVLDKMLQWMDKRRCSFTTSYTKGLAWNVGTHIKLKLPHNTNNTFIECVIEDIEKSKNDNTVSVKIVLLDQIPTVFDTLVYQDSMIKTGSLLQWQDVHTKSTNPAYQGAV